MRILFVFTFLFAGSTFADDAVVTRDNLCVEMQDQLENDGIMKVRNGLFGLSTYFVYSEETVKNDPQFLGCDFDQVLSRAFVRSKDKRRCRLGFECQTDWDSVDSPL